MILITFYDLFKSVVLPRPAINKFVLIRRAFFMLWNFWLWANERQAPSRREGWLATFGPIAVLFMFATWGMILMVGYAFIIDGLRAWQPEKFPQLAGLRLNREVLAFAAIASLLAGVGVGLVPALRGASVDLASALKASGRTASMDRARHRLLCHAERPCDDQPHLSARA